MKELGSKYSKFLYLITIFMHLPIEMYKLENNVSSKMKDEIFKLNVNPHCYNLRDISQFVAHTKNLELIPSVSLRIQSKCGKIRTRITPNTDTFYAVDSHKIIRGSSNCSNLHISWNNHAIDLKFNYINIF